MISTFWFKKLKKKIQSENGGDYYEINQRYLPTLLDLGLVEYRRWTEKNAWGIVSFSDYFVTDLGKEECVKHKHGLSGAVGK